MRGSVKDVPGRFVKDVMRLDRLVCASGWYVFSGRGADNEGCSGCRSLGKSGS